MSTVSRIPPMEHQDSADHQIHVNISRFLLIILCISFPHPITMCDRGFPARVALNCKKHIGHFLLEFEGSSLKRCQFYEAPLFLIGNYVYTLSPGLKEDMTPWHHNTFCGHNISPGIFSFTTCACVLSSPRYIYAHWCTVMSFISDGILYIKSRGVYASLQA